MFWNFCNDKDLNSDNLDACLNKLANRGFSLWAMRGNFYEHYSHYQHTILFYKNCRRSQNSQDKWNFKVHFDRYQVFTTLQPLDIFNQEVTNSSSCKRQSIAVWKVYYLQNDLMSSGRNNEPKGVKKVFFYRYFSCIHQSSSSRCKNSQIQNSKVTAISIETNIQRLTWVLNI